MNVLNIKILQITSEEQLNSYIDEIVLLYQTVFSEPPSNQIFDIIDVSAMFSMYLRTGYVLIAQTEQSIIGFGTMLPFLHSNANKEETFHEGMLVSLNEYFSENYNFSIHNLYYVSDMAVNKDFRKHGVGSLLLNELIKLANDNVIIRFSARKKNLQSFYEKHGFSLMSLKQSVIYKYVNGDIGLEEKMFLIKCL